MSENSTSTVVEQNSGSVATDAMGTAAIFESDNEGAVNTAPTFVQAEEQEDAQSTSAKEIFAFFQSKVCTMILWGLSILLTVVCTIQTGLWCIALLDTYTDFLDAFKDLEYLKMFVAIFILVSIGFMIGGIVKSIIGLVKREIEPCFSMVTIMFAFYVFALFIEEMFGSHMLIDDFTPSIFLIVLAGILVLYAVLRLLLKDFGARIVPFAFSCGAIILAVVMFSYTIGDFAIYKIENGFGNQSPLCNLADLNAYKYVQSNITKNSAYVLETVFYNNGIGSQLDVDAPVASIILVLFQLFSVLVVNILPFAALSLIGYLIYGLISRNYIQYYALHACNKVCVSMLIVSILSLGATVALKFLCDEEGVNLLVEFDYTNMVITILSCIAMLVLTSLPWKIYGILYRRRNPANHQK